ncbi:MAG: NAD-binding protein, partial [Gammaproteobacteria bacterium]|nr:NAD-binding protein [Gammaproteobacteria bacterium]
MKILILGAGQVGSSVAANLASEANDITLVDSKIELLAELRDRLDIQ